MGLHGTGGQRRFWLLPILSAVARVLSRVYYRLTYAGERVPNPGPVLLVANHPNSLFDPVLVIAAAGRAVRFLAKAPLFTDPKVGWLVRGSGAIPVYRRSDDPDQLSRNQEMFRDVQTALGEGAAVAIFPEGISHSGPGLTRLKTGAARIALGFAGRRRVGFPIVPVGLVFRAKDVFRSEAQVIMGPPVRWDDLVGREVSDSDAVHELTERIGRAMRRVTVNLDAWEDQPLAECALDVWEAAHPELSSRVGRVARMKVTTDLMRSVREESDPDLPRLVSQVRRHSRRLAVLRLAPRDLARDTGPFEVLRWSARRMAVLSPPAVVAALAGQVLFWVPYTITGRMAAAFRPDVDQLATHKLLVGVPVYALWILLLAVAAGVARGVLAFAGTLCVLPVLGMVGLWIREQWRGARDDVRSFLFRRTRRALFADLRTEQDELARRLDAVYRHHHLP
jgi:glycerol-3-phosphate O-acyltransferase/dihydroxyacetone phosphate acyltransferase